MSKYISFSYVLGNDTPAYGNYHQAEFKPLRSIAAGDTANMTEFHFNNHIGTHVDYPHHFIQEGRTGDTYDPADFVFERIRFIEIPRTEGMIETTDFENLTPDDEIELLIIKTGMCDHRGTDKYWKDYPGITADSAEVLLSKFPKLRAIGFDFISISSIKNREEGRRSHRAFLGKGIWIIEDMDLTKVSAPLSINKLYLGPLLFDHCDGGQCSILAEIADE